MEKQAQVDIPDNISNSIFNKRRILRDINSYGDKVPPLSQFLDNNCQDIRLLYRGEYCWTSLKREAGSISYDDLTRRLEKGLSTSCTITPWRSAICEGLCLGRRGLSKAGGQIFRTHALLPHRSGQVG